MKLVKRVKHKMHFSYYTRPLLLRCIEGLIDEYDDPFAFGMLKCAQKDYVRILYSYYYDVDVSKADNYAKNVLSFSDWEIKKLKHFIEKEKTKTFIKTKFHKFYENVKKFDIIFELFDNCELLEKLDNLEGFPIFAGYYNFEIINQFDYKINKHKQDSRNSEVFFELDNTKCKDFIDSLNNGIKILPAFKYSDKDEFEVGFSPLFFDDENKKLHENYSNLVVMKALYLVSILNGLKNYKVNKTINPFANAILSSYDSFVPSTDLLKWVNKILRNYKLLKNNEYNLQDLLSYKVFGMKKAELPLFKDSDKTVNCIFPVFNSNTEQYQVSLYSILDVFLSGLKDGNLNNDVKELDYISEFNFYEKKQQLKQENAFFVPDFKYAKVQDFYEYLQLSNVNEEISGQSFKVLSNYDYSLFLDSGTYNSLSEHESVDLTLTFVAKSFNDNLFPRPRFHEIVDIRSDHTVQPRINLNKGKLANQEEGVEHDGHTQSYMNYLNNVQNQDSVAPKGNGETIVIGNSSDKTIKSLGSIKTIREVSKKIVDQTKRDLEESAKGNKSKMQVFSDSMLKMLKPPSYDSDDLS